MRIGLLGMSGVGKTYWATQLAHSGFDCFHCDDLIAAQLQLQVGQALTTVYDLGAWMGLPDQEGFGERERKYLDVESQTLAHITDWLTHDRLPMKNLVMDFTGSAIYADEETLMNLRRWIRIVYLAITPAVQSQMLTEYIQRPRPLIWNGLFQKEPDEGTAAALKRSYASLIAFREERYERLSDVKLEYQFHRQTGLPIASFLEAIAQSVKRDRAPNQADQKVFHHLTEGIL